MSNGIASVFRFTSIEKELDKILDLWKKYDYQDYKLPIDAHLTIERSRKRAAIYICQNGERVIVAYVGAEGIARSLASPFAAGVTLGLVDLYRVKFLTSDKTVANQQFISATAKTLKQRLPELELYMKNASEKRWGIK